jgi:hypothetical protein
MRDQLLKMEIQATKVVHILNGLRQKELNRKLTELIILYYNIFNDYNFKTLGFWGLVPRNHSPCMHGL